MVRIVSLGKFVLVDVSEHVMHVVHDLEDADMMKPMPVWGLVPLANLNMAMTAVRRAEGKWH